MDKPSLLLCTNGCETTQPALDYGIWLAQALQSAVKLLGIIEDEDQDACVSSLLEELSGKLAEIGLDYSVELDRGRGTPVIARHASSGDHLTVFGPLGRPVWRRVIQGRSFRRILARVEKPLLYVPRNPQQLKRILLCMGGLGHEASMERMGIYLARKTGARVTLLHIVEPVTLQYPTASEIHHHWQDVLETDTPQGRRLRQALDEVQSSGLEAEIKIRHGNVIHEILDEIHQGGYDLVGMGSAYSTHSLRQRYLPNVTAEVAEAAVCPVLSVRAGGELPWVGESLTGNKENPPSINKGNS